MKQRLAYALATLVVIGLGLASRRWHLFPAILEKYPGDALWGLMIFTLLGIVWPTVSLVQRAGLALAICYAVEFSQLLDVAWLNELRATTLGHLLLGSAFHWPDLLAYPCGIGLGWMIARTLDK